MKILHVSCSPRGPASESQRLARRIIALLQETAPGATVLERPLADGDIPHVDPDYATSQQSSADVSDDGSARRSEALIGELEDADVVVIGTPMHNFTVPSVLKVWIDHVVRVRRTFNVSPQGKIGLLRDRPVFVAVSSGGLFAGENARQPDFLTSYLKAVLAIIGLHNVTFFTIQGAAFGPTAVATTRAATEVEMRDHFAQHPPGVRMRNGGIP